MGWQLGFQQSKLARRLMAVFFFCVLVPVLGLAAVSYLQVKHQLTEQSELRLERDSKAVVMSALERLVLADGLIRTLAPDDAEERIGRQTPDAINPIESAIWTDGEGRALRALGQWTRTPIARPEEVERLRQGTTLRAHPENGRVLLARETSHGQLWVAVDTAFLWSAANEFAQLRGEGTTCVLAADASPIRCDTRIRPADLEPHLRTRQPFLVDIGGEPYRAVTREMYFDWYFGAEPWSVVLAEPVSEAVAPLESFRRIFAPVALLSVLVVLFASSMQLRRIFARLVRLRTATAGLAAGHFDQLVSIEGDDEITELAGSFNHMASQLGEQFGLLRAAGAVDRAALETETVHELSHGVATALGESFPNCDRVICMGLISPDDARLEGSLAYAGPTGASRLIKGGLSAKATSALARLTGSGSHTGHELASLLEAPELISLFGSKRFALSPIRLEGETLGFVGIGSETPCAKRREYTRQLTDQVAVALSSVKRLDELDRLNWGALTALARTVDAASEWTAGHSERVASYSEQLGRRLGLPETEVERLRRGGLLHDIGKLGVPSHILEKPGKLTAEEFQAMQQHTLVGAKILEPIVTFSDIIPLVLHHHERIDGNGYPMKLAGSAIPYGARIMAVADTFDALTSDRPYRDGMPLEQALGILLEIRGTQLEAEMVDEFVAMLREREGDGWRASTTKRPTSEVPFHRRTPELIG